MDAEARVCARALEIGQLAAAEEACLRALGDTDKDVLAPPLRSQRLYRLASIKRQRAKYGEAAQLLSQSLALEQTLSGPDSPQVARRHLEMALILAGQKQWRQGAQLLERTVPVADRLNENEQAMLVNILRQYATQLQRSQATAQASRLQAAAAGLNQKQARQAD